MAATVTNSEDIVTNSELSLEVIRLTAAAGDALEVAADNSATLIKHIDDMNAHGKDVDAAIKTAVDAHNTASTPHPGKFAAAAHDHDTAYAAKSHTHTAADLGIPSQFFKGFIAPFYGSLGGAGSKYPVISGVAQTAWQVCDGTNGTPDMRNRVPVGVSSSKGLGNTGGSETSGTGGSVSVSSASVTLSGNTGATTLTVAQMPAHTHGGAHGNARDLYIREGSGSGWRLQEASFSTVTQSTGGSTSHTHPLSGSAGSHSHSASFSGNTINVVQPYLALHYIMYMG